MPSEAEVWYIRCAEMWEQSCVKNSKKFLSYVYKKLYSLARNKNTPEGISEGEMWLKKSRELSSGGVRKNIDDNNRKSRPMPTLDNGNKNKEIREKLQQKLKERSKENPDSGTE